MPIRVMHVVNSLGKGGLENGLVNLILRLDAERFEHVVCTIRGLGPNLERLPLDRVRVFDLERSGWKARLQAPVLVRAIRETQPDIVHSRNWGSIEAVFAARFARVGGVVHSEHGFEADASTPEPWRRNRLRRLAFELAHRVLTVSWQLRDIQAKRTGFASERIRVIHNGVDCQRFAPDAAARQRMRAELGLTDGELCVGCVANLVPVKDHRTLLAAVSVSVRNNNTMRLVLVGEGPERTALQQLVDGDPGLKGRVRFLGSSSRVPELLQAMDVFVLPSLAEGICNSLLEAMASGIPVAATSVGGTPEVVADGRSGLLFAARDVAALATILSTLHSRPELRSQLGRQAIDHVKRQFSIDSMVQAYDQLYRSIRPAAATPALSPRYH